MSWFSVWWKKVKEPIEGIAKAKVIAEIHEVNIADNADDLVSAILELAKDYGVTIPTDLEEAFGALIAQEGEELREEIVDMVERIQL